MPRLTNSSLILLVGEPRITWKMLDISKMEYWGLRYRTTAMTWASEVSTPPSEHTVSKNCSTSV